MRTTDARNIAILWNYYSHVYGNGLTTSSSPFHAYYQDEVAIYAIDEVELMNGNLPTKQRRLVEAWAELHQYELLKGWHHLQSGQLPNSIEPLK